TTAGNTHYVCQYDNSHTKDESIAALGHDYESVVTAPTCTEAGYTTHTCSRCDDTYTDTPVASLGHDFQFTETVDPTCTTAGYDVYDCSRCDATENRNEVAALGHNYTSEVTTPPGCTTTGERTYTCSRCGDTYTEEITAIGHDWGEWTQTTAPTCTEAGEEQRVCANDNSHVETREVAALGHDYQFTSTVPATCTTGGYDLYTCSRGCGATEQRNATSALEHDIEGVDWTVVTPATTSSTGLKVKYCTRCHAVVVEEEIPMLSGPAVTGLEIYPGDSAILVGGTVQLTAVITPANASNPAVTWTSSDTSIATVSNAGLVTGVTTGSVTITATSVDDNTVYDTVTVTIAPLMTQTGYIDEGRHYNGVTSGTQINITPLSSYTLQFATTYTPSNYSGATLAPTLSFYTSSAGTTPATLATNTKITMIDLTVAAAPRYYSYTVGAGVSSIPLTSFTEMGTGSAYSLKTGSSSITEKLVFVVDYGQSSSTATSHSPKLQYNLTY
ncbi:MAG: Ig-like domain-containing protein, partial [Clostridia bacterium]|nr:Ig-like domain-containing protein [Clostridia bacterium]